MLEPWTRDGALFFAGALPNVSEDRSCAVRGWCLSKATEFFDQELVIEDRDRLLTSSNRLLISTLYDTWNLAVLKINGPAIKAMNSRPQTKKPPPAQKSDRGTHVHYFPPNQSIKTSTPNLTALFPECIHLATLILWMRQLCGEIQGNADAQPLIWLNNFGMSFLHSSVRRLCG